MPSGHVSGALGSATDAPPLRKAGCPRPTCKALGPLDAPAAREALDALEADAVRFKEAGLGLMIFYLPPPHTPDVLEPLARTSMLE